MNVGRITMYLGRPSTSVKKVHYLAQSQSLRAQAIEDNCSFYEINNIVVVYLFVQVGATAGNIFIWTVFNTCTSWNRNLPWVEYSETLPPRRLLHSLMTKAGHSSLAANYLLKLELKVTTQHDVAGWMNGPLHSNFDFFRLSFKTLQIVQIVQIGREG